MWNGNRNNIYLLGFGQGLNQWHTLDPTLLPTKNVALTIFSLSLLHHHLLVFYSRVLFPTTPVTSVDLVKIASDLHVSKSIGHVFAFILCDLTHDTAYHSYTPPHSYTFFTWLTRGTTNFKWSVRCNYIVLWQTVLGTSNPSGKGRKCHGWDTHNEQEMLRPVFFNLGCTFK